MEPEIIEIDDSSDEQEEEKVQASCGICHSVFDTTSAFMNHMVSYHKKGPLKKCPFCTLVYEEADLAQHLALAHPSQQNTSGTSTSPVVCNICGEKFPFKECLDAHSTVHVIEKKYNKAADNVSNENKQFSCSICLKKFFVEKALLAHRKRKHIIMKKITQINKKSKFACRLCDRTFPKQRNLLIHVSWHKRNRRQDPVDVSSGSQAHTKAKCQSEAQIGAKTHETRRVTLDEVENDSSYPVATMNCDMCPRTFNSTRSLGSHTRWHTLKLQGYKKKSHSGKAHPGIQSKSRKPGRDFKLPIEPTEEFTCDICQKKYQKRKGLALHIRWHVRKGEIARRHSSSIEATSADQSQDNSSGAHHTPSSESQFQQGKSKLACNVCQKKFNNRLSLIAHTRWYAAHKKNCKRTCKTKNQRTESLVSVPSESSPKSVNLASCSHCNEKFEFLYHYRIHMERHLSKKTHVCHVCGECYAFQSSLETHELENHYSNILIFYCRNCSRPFKRKLSRDEHLRSCTRLVSDASLPSSNSQSKTIFEPCPNRSSATTSTPVASTKESTHSTPIQPEEQVSGIPQSETPSHSVSLHCDVSSHSTPLAQQNEADLFFSTDSSSREHCQQLNSSVFEYLNSSSSPLKSVGCFLCNICEKSYLLERGLLIHVLCDHSSDNYPLSWEETAPAEQGRCVEMFNSISISSNQMLSSEEEAPLEAGVDCSDRAPTIDSPDLSSPLHQTEVECSDRAPTIDSPDHSTLNESPVSSQNEIVGESSDSFSPGNGPRRNSNLFSNENELQNSGLHDPGNSSLDKSRVSEQSSVYHSGVIFTARSSLVLKNI